MAALVSNTGVRPAADRRGLAQVAVAATLWGCWSIFLRPAALDPRWSAAVVLAAMSSFGAPLLFRPAARGPAVGGPRTGRDWGMMLLIGVFDAANAGLFFAAMARTTVALAVLSHYLGPALIALLAPWIVGTPRRRDAPLWALLATAGLALVMQPWRLSSLAPRHMVGAAMGAGSAVFYALNVCVAKRATTRFTAEEQLVYHSAIAAVALGVAAPWGAPPPWPGVGLAALAGLLIGATAALLFVRGVARVPAEHAAVLTFLEPLTAVVVGALWFREPAGPLALVGGAVVLLAGALSSRRG